MWPRYVSGSCPPDYKHTKELSEAFFDGLIDVARRIGARPMDLLKVMNFESGVSASRANQRSTAIGLIQFMAQSLDNLGWKGTRQQFGELSAEFQLPYVEAYYRHWAPHGLDSVARLYMATLLPACLTNGESRKPDFVLCGRNGPLAWAYQANRVLDKGLKGYVTTQDLQDVIESAAKGPRWNELVMRLSDAEVRACAVEIDVSPDPTDAA